MFGLYKDMKQILGLKLIYPEHQLGALENCGMGLKWGEAGTSPGRGVWFFHEKLVWNCLPFTGVCAGFLQGKEQDKDEREKKLSRAFIFWATKVNPLVKRFDWR